MHFYPCKSPDPTSDKVEMDIQTVDCWCPFLYPSGVCVGVYGSVYLYCHLLVVTAGQRLGTV